MGIQAEETEPGPLDTEDICPSREPFGIWTVLLYLCPLSFPQSQPPTIDPWPLPLTPL